MPTQPVELVAALARAATLLALLAACGGAEVFVPVVRFDDAAGGNGPGLAAIMGETRPSLRPQPTAVLVHRRELEVPADGVIALRPQLPTELRGAREVVIDAFVLADGARHQLEARRVQVDVDGRVPLRLELGPRRGAVDLVVIARAVPIAEAEPIETGTVKIPERARLELGFGILPPQLGPVRFRLLLCESECEALVDELIDPEEPHMQSWQDRTVDLAALAGRRVSLRFVIEHPGADRSGWPAAVWSAPALYAPIRRQRPDLVLISIDTLRADHLPTYGSTRDTAPFVETALARRGVVFEHCISAATTTAASHMTMFTSLQPSVHAVREYSTPESRRLAPAAVTLAEQLRAYGYTNGAFTENAAIALMHGFARGFDNYRENKSFRTEGHVERTLADGLAWLSRHRHKQFFLFLHTYQVHTPYSPPPEYGSLFEGDGVDAHPDVPPAWHPDLYDREIRYTDDQLREFFERAEREGLLEDAIVVLTSDHGEAFLEHGFLGHGPAVHEEVLRVPLVFAGAGIPAGRRVEVPVGLVDLMPTLLGLSDVPAPSGLMGRSIAGLVLGRGDAVPFWERTLYSEAWFTAGITASGRVKVAQPTFSARRGTHKLIRYLEGEGARWVYYDLARDPGEREDRYDPDDSEVAQLHEGLERYAEQMKSLRIALEREQKLSVWPPLDPQRDEKLRALGYLD